MPMTLRDEYSHNQNKWKVDSRWKKCWCKCYHSFKCLHETVKIFMTRKNLKFAIVGDHFKIKLCLQRFDKF